MQACVVQFIVLKQSRTLPQSAFAEHAAPCVQHFVVWHVSHVAEPVVKLPQFMPPLEPLEPLLPLLPLDPLEPLEPLLLPLVRHVMSAVPSASQPFAVALPELLHFHDVDFASYSVLRLAGTVASCASQSETQLD
jgi:hypothetical protein